MEIPLDPLKTPQQNAAKYYKDYNRAKTAEQVLTVQISRGKQELEYLESVLENITLAESDRDLQEIRQELADAGYLKRQKTAAKREKRVISKPMDVWLHTQKIHGSHVILHTGGTEPDGESLREAAMLAAWFSQGRESGNVPVDYTPVKFVKKPAGAKPGMVVYYTYETMYVTPEEELVKKLRIK